MLDEPGVRAALWHTKKVEQSRELKELQGALAEKAEVLKDGGSAVGIRLVGG